MGLEMILARFLPIFLVVTLCSGTIDPCRNYASLNETSRSITTRYPLNLAHLHNDNKLNNSWYRFNGGKDSKIIQNSCIRVYGRCGTLSPGWMNGTHPTANDGIVERKVCFYFYNDCCFYHVSIMVKNCDSFLIYRLPSTAHVPLLARYCSRQIDQCDPNPCQNNGSCTRERNGYTCSCPSSYTGTSCEIDVDPCRHDPCVNGMCLKFNLSFLCLCKQGYTGSRCENDLDECSTGIARCHEICLNTIGSYKCSCGKGSILLADKYSCYDPCKSHTSIQDNSRSVFSVNNTQVLCDTKTLNDTWYRFNGNYNNRMMAASPAPMGKCSTVSTGWLSQRHPKADQGIVPGTACFTWPNNNCHWNTTIQIKNCGRFFVYKLPPPSKCYLRYCSSSYDYCDPDPCLNGSCHSLRSRFLCNCTAGSTGKVCDQDINECQSNPCRHGTCLNLQARYQCVCNQGYTGINCDTDVNECQQQNGGCEHLCINADGGYHCECWQGFVGRNQSRQCLDPCQVYKSVRDSSRLLSNRRLIPLLCDGNTITPRWYRLYDYSSRNVMLATQCTPPLRCQTLSTGWMNGTHPTLQEGIVSRKACYNFEENCCYAKVDIKVKNCTHFFVYHLSPPNSCVPKSRFCVNMAHACDPNPCRHGNCTSKGSLGYACQCQPGYDGNLCQRDINECSSNPCVSGQCLNHIDKYVCVCPSGITGQQCDTDINECSTNNGGCSHICHNTYSSYYCTCPKDIELSSDNHTCYDPCTYRNSYSTFNNSLTSNLDLSTMSSIFNDCSDYSHGKALWYRPNQGKNCFSLARWTNISSLQVYTQNGLKNRSVCFRFGSDDCLKTIQISTKSCSGGVIYKVDRLSACYLNYCDQIDNEDICWFKPCINGKCEPTIDGYRCDCFYGYVGQNCSVKDPCIPHPCNNGTCIRTQDHNYRCNCDDLYVGKNCLMSTQDYCRYGLKTCFDIAVHHNKTLKQNETLTNGRYAIYDTNTCKYPHPAGYEVYCDFNSQPGYIWTLIESFSRNNGRTYRFRRPFSYDSPVNSYSPISNYDNYRMSYSQMYAVYQRDQSISGRALWRATCNFFNRTIPFPAKPRDIVWGRFNQLSFFSNRMRGCVRVDYMNVRGYSNSRNNYYMWIYYNNYHLYIDTYNNPSCGFSRFPNTRASEQNFGQYSYYNSQFSCTSNGQSLTNWWIGGKIN